MTENTPAPHRTTAVHLDLLVELHYYSDGPPEMALLEGTRLLAKIPVDPDLYDVTHSDELYADLLPELFRRWLRIDLP